MMAEVIILDRYRFNYLFNEIAARLIRDGGCYDFIFDVIFTYLIDCNTNLIAIIRSLNNELSLSFVPTQYQNMVSGVNLNTQSPLSVLIQMILLLLASTKELSYAVRTLCSWPRKDVKLLFRVLLFNSMFQSFIGLS